MGRGKLGTFIGETPAQFLTTQIAPDDEDAARLAYRLNALALTGAAVALLYSVVWLFVQPELLSRLILVVPVVLLLGAVILLVRSGREHLAAHVFLAGSWLMITLVVGTAGGTRSPFFGFYVALVMGAVILASLRFALVYGALTLVCGLVMVHLANIGVIVEPFATPMSAWLTQAAITVLVAFNGYIIVRDIKRSLHQMQQALVERERTDAALRESEQKFRTIFELAPYGITIQRQGGVFTDVNPAFLERLGLSVEQAVGKNVLEMPEMWDPAEVQALMKDLRTRGKVSNRELTIHRADGTQAIMLISSQQLDLAGETFVLTVSTDISERVRAEEALRASEEEFRAFFDMSPYPTMILQGNVRFADANSAFLQGIGLPRDQVIGHAADEMGISINGRDMQEYLSSMREIIVATGRLDNIEVEIGFPSKRTGSFLFSARRLELQAEPYVLAIAIDISEIRAAENALKRSEAHLRALLDATPDVAFMMSLDGILLTLNDALAKSIGRNVEQTMGQNAFSLLEPALRIQRAEQFERVVQSGKPARWEDESPTGWWDNSVYPILSATGSVEAFAVYSRNISEQKRLRAELETYAAQLEKRVDDRTQALRRAKDQLELILNTTTDALAFAQPNGDILLTNPAFRTMFSNQAILSVEDVLSSLESDGPSDEIYSALVKVMYDDVRQRFEARLKSKAGEEIHIDLSLIPVQAFGDDAEKGVLLSGHDISQLKEVERLKARFVADAVHDLATPISGLSTRLYLLKRTPEKLDDHVRALENQVQHLQYLLDDLRTLSEIDRGQIALRIEACDVNQMAQRVFDTYEPIAMSRNQALVLSLEPGLPEARLDPRHMERVLVNLVANAINYSPDNKAIIVETISEDDALVIRVADQGIGISAHDLPHVFERFYRTEEARKSVASGTGLGLAITKEVVELHGGSVEVSSQPGHGSTFTLRLPLRSSTARG